MIVSMKNTKMHIPSRTLIVIAPEEPGLTSGESIQRITTFIIRNPSIKKLKTLDMILNLFATTTLE